MIKHC